MCCAAMTYRARRMPEPADLSRTPTDQQACEQLRSRFEAWNAQIERLLGALPVEHRFSAAVARLVEQHKRVRERVAAWLGGKRERRELEREWARLKRAWSRTLDAVEIT